MIGTLCNNTNLLINYYNYLALYMYKKYRCDLFLKHPTLVIKKKITVCHIYKAKVDIFFFFSLFLIAHLIKKVYIRFASSIHNFLQSSKMKKYELKNLFLPSN